MKLRIAINIPDEPKIEIKPAFRPAPKKIADDYKCESLLKKVQRYAKCVDSDEESAKEWYYLQRLYEKLQKVKKLNEEQEQIVYIIEPLILKYNTNAKAIDGSKMLRGKDHLINKKEK